MSRQKLFAPCLLIAGFLAGCAASLVAREESDARISVVRDYPERPRGGDGSLLPRSTTKPMELRLTEAAMAAVRRVADTESNEDAVSRQGFRTILVLFPVGGGGGLADPDHGAPPDHCAFYWGAYYYEWHC